MKIVLIVLRVVLGLVFLAAGLAKVFGVPMLVQEFHTVGLGEWFRYFTALCEIGGALLLVRAVTVPFGAALLTCVSIGALVAQLAVLHQDPIHAAVLAALCGFLAIRSRADVAAMPASATRP